MDGVAGLTQRAIPPGETFRYEFTLRRHPQGSVASRATIAELRRDGIKV
jgi:Multicopper oxidase